MNLLEIVKRNKEGEQPSIPILQGGGLTESKVQGIINKYSRNKSPLSAKDYINVSNETGVPLELLLVQGIQESNFGTAGRAVRTKNVGNVGNVDDGGSRYMSSWVDGLRVQANLLKREYGATSKNAVKNLIEKGFVRPKDGARYASDKNYEVKLSGLLKTITGDNFDAYSSSTTNNSPQYYTSDVDTSSNEAYQKAMIASLNAQTESQLQLNQAQVNALQIEQQEKLALQEENKQKEANEQAQAVLEERSKQKEALLEIGLQTIPQHIEYETTALNSIASSPINFQYQGGFEKLIQAKNGGVFQEGGVINLDEVVVKAETPLHKLSKEFEKNNNYSEFVYGRGQTTFDSYETRKKEYEILRKKYIANEIASRYEGKRGKILDNIAKDYGEDVQTFVTNNSTNKNIRGNLIDNFKSGILNLNGSYNPYLSVNEKRDRNVLSRVSDISDVLSPLSIPYNTTLGRVVANNSGEEYNFQDAITGEIPENREITAEIFGDPLNLLSVGALRTPNKVVNNILKLEDIAKENNFYRVVQGQEAFDDLVKSGIVRSINSAPKKDGVISLLNRPTAFPSFSKGFVAEEYAKSNPINYIIESNSDKIKVSTLGRHGKGTTYFPTNAEGEYINSLNMSEANVYKHIGNGEYEKVIDNIKYKKGGKFHNIYDSYGKPNINTFKSKFIK